jgi:chromosome segregation ATPase
MKERKAYVEKLQEEIENVDREIRHLENRLIEFRDSIRKDYEQQIEFLKRKRNEIKDRWLDISVAGEKAWESLRDGVEESRDVLNRSLKSAKSDFYREVGEKIKNWAD